jgi:cell division protein FtsB
MKKSSFRKILSLPLLSGLVLGGIIAYQNRWELRDQIVARRYLQAESSEDLRSELKLSKQGDLVFRASLTEVDGKDKFKQKCPVRRFEEASVLGCYAKQKIYVLEVNEPKLKGVEEVTAAHELLHAQFERMSKSEKEKLFPLLTKLNSGLKDEEVMALVKSYGDQLGEGEDLYNEMFAIFGTQVGDVGAELEEFYQKYFSDREAIVQMYKNYDGEFKNLQDEIEGYDAKLKVLKDQKDKLEKEVNELGSKMEAEKTELDVLKNSGAFEEYRNLALSYNGEVESYNAKVEQIKDLVGEYNEIVEVRNSLAVSVQNLQDELNANVSEKSEN